MKFVLIVFLLNGGVAPVALEGTFPIFTSKETACAALVVTAKKMGAVGMAGCELQIEI